MGSAAPSRPCRDGAGHCPAPSRLPPDSASDNPAVPLRRGVWHHLSTSQRAACPEGRRRRPGSQAFRDGYPESFSGREPDRLSPSDFAEDRLSLLVRRVIEGEQITLSRGAEILGYSLDDMRQLALSWTELGIQ